MPSKSPSPEPTPGPSKRKEFTAGPNDQGRRLDSLVRKFLPQLSLSGIQKALRQGDIRLNGKKSTPETRINEGDSLSIWTFLWETGQKEERKNSKVPSFPVEDWVVARSPQLLFINKPKGMLVHSGEGETSGEPLLEVLVAHYLKDKIAEGLSFRPGPLHRLDRQTSGLLAFSASLEGARAFSSLVQAHKIRKIYLTLLEGRMLEAQQRDEAIDREEGSFQSHPSNLGQPAQTRFTPLAWSSQHTLALAEISTGRTHQIRVHAQTAGHPLAGDSKYGSKASKSDGEGGLPGYGWFLHAWTMVFPDDGLGWKSLTAPLPPHVLTLLAPFLSLDPAELDRILDQAAQNIAH